MEEEYEEIDILEIFRKLWAQRRIILIVTAVFAVLGLLAAVTTDRKYVTKIVFVPQFNSITSSKVSSLAAMAGVSLDDGSNDGPISPMVYPQIMNNQDMLKELIYTPLHFSCSAAPITIYDYLTDPRYAQKSFLKTLKKFTIGLPGLVKGALFSLKKEKDETDVPGINSITVPILTKEENDVVKYVRKCLELSVVKTEKHVILTSTMKEPVASAELADATYSLLKKYISKFKVAKSEKNLEYIEGQYKEAKANYEARQEELARFKDSNYGVKTASASMDLQKLTTETDLARMLYLEVSKSRLTAKVKLSEDNVAFTEITPAYVPRKAANSRMLILLIWIFMGGVFGSGYVLARDFLEKKKKEASE